MGAHFTLGAVPKSRVAEDLRRAGPEVLQQPGQEVALRVTRGQVHPDAAAGFPDVAPDLQELEAQGADLGGGQSCALEVAAQQPKQAISGGVEQQPELVGQEAMATQAIGPHQDQGLRLGLAELLEQSLENRHRPLGGVGIAGTQHRRQGKAVLPVKDQQQMLPVRVEIAVAEAELLLAVGGVVGGVQVHSDDLPGGGMGLEVQLQQLMREATQVLGGNPVLKA